MAWLQINVLLPAQQTELIETVFTQLNSLAITYSDGGNQAIFEHELGNTPLWQFTRVTGLFENTDAKQLVKQVRQLLNADSPVEIHCQTLENKDWERAWLEHFKPMQFGERLWVIPNAYEPPDANAINIFLDPGLAFGTGTHETTALCLQWLAQNQINQLSVIDFGCGSGILAIAAAKLGAKKIIAIDIDPQAIIATKENSIKNQVENRIKAEQTVPMQQVDLLIANILAKPLINLAPLFAKLLKPGATLVMSGILSEQADRLIEHYQSNFTQFNRQKKGDWILLSCRRLV